MIEYDDIMPFEYSVFCGDCGVMPSTSEDKQVAVSVWNTRIAPPIGNCRDCDRWRGKPGDEDAPCRDCDGVMEADNFCKNFEPRSNKDGFK